MFIFYFVDTFSYLFIKFYVFILGFTEFLLSYNFWIFFQKTFFTLIIDWILRCFRWSLYVWLLSVVTWTFSRIFIWFFFFLCYFSKINWLFFGGNFFIRIFFYLYYFSKINWLFFRGNLFIRVLIFFIKWLSIWIFFTSPWVFFYLIW